MTTFKQKIARTLTLFSLIVATTFVVGCYDTNYEIGAGLLPNNQETLSGQLEFYGNEINGDRIYTARLHKSNQINVTSQSIATFGAQRDSRFGERRSGFFTQFTPLYQLNEWGFGNDPKIDSMVLFFTLSDYTGDTTHVVRYGVYEVIDDSFLRNSSDSIFNSESALAVFDVTGSNGVLGERLFTFDYPDQDNWVFVSDGYVTMTEMTDAGYDFSRRLMLMEGEDGSQIDYEVYNEDDWEDFTDAFGGLYIVPVEMSEQPFNDGVSDGGVLFSASIESSGFMIYARNAYAEDPMYAVDTVGMSYTFRDTYETDYGGVSLGVAEHNHNGTLDPTSSDAMSAIYVEGLDGIVTEFTFEKALFDEFERVIEEANENLIDGVDPYIDIQFNMARMTMYIEDATEYDIYTAVDQDAVYRLNDLPTRLGMYSTLSTFLDDNDDIELEGINDYNYAYEAYYSTTSSYDGTLSRSKGCYVMNIPLYLQQLWAYYVEDKGELGRAPNEEEWELLDWNKAYVAPIAGGLFTPRYAQTQGASSDNVVPMRLQIDYTLLK